MSEHSEERHYPVAIIGSGIAGMSAAIYAGRGGNAPLVIKGDEPGGQLTLTTDVANYPGFPEGISGPDLVQRMTEQAEQFGAEFLNGTVEDLRRVDGFEIELANGDVYTSDAAIIASGASARTLGIPGEDELMGYGVSTCATCDGAFFRGEDMVVIGGGDAAFEEAAFLTRFADTVHLIHRREEFRAEQYWVDTVYEDHVEEGDIVVHKNTEVTEIHGSQDEGIDKVSLVSHPEGYPTDRIDDPDTEESDLEVGAVFIAIGHTPNTEFLEDTGVVLDDAGYILIPENFSSAGDTATGVPGLFAAGDVADQRYQQAATAGGMGVKAALDAEAYLDEHGD